MGLLELLELLGLKGCRLRAFGGFRVRLLWLLVRLRLWFKFRALELLGIRALGVEDSF